MEIELPTAFEDVFAQFESAWTGSGPQEIVPFLPPSDSPHRRTVLLELIRIDMDRRQASGDTPRVGDYLTTFPELVADPAAAASLARFEAAREATPGLERTDSFIDSTNPDPILAAWNASAERPLAAGRYRLGEEIARGGMGAVYRVRDNNLDRDLAVKIMLADPSREPAMAARFVAEAKLTAGLQHPGIVPVHEVGELPDGRPFFAMKLVRGRTLAKRLAERPDPTADLPAFLDVFGVICRTVGFAHSRGVIHRDIKPHNVMVGDFGEVQVMDWGLAKEMQSAECGVRNEAAEATAGRLAATRSGARGEDGTHAGTVMGTPAYMAPEQARGETVDARVDVFSLGAVLCQLLTGKPPFAGSKADAVLRRAAEADLKGAAQRLEGCGADAELIAIAKQCLSPDRLDRPVDAGEVAKLIDAYRTSVEMRLRAAETERAKSAVRAVEHRKRRQVRRALFAAIGLLGCSGLGFTWWQDRLATQKQIDDTQRATEEQTRRANNSTAVANWCEQCEAALRRDDGEGAVIALKELDLRIQEGVASEWVGRIDRCRADLSLLRELNEVDVFRWTPVENRLPEAKQIASRWRATFTAAGLDPAILPAAEIARIVKASHMRERLQGTLEVWLAHSQDSDVREVLRVLDPDRYREAVRDAVVTRNGEQVAKLADQTEALAQSPGFAAALGGSKAVSVKRRRTVLDAALRDQPGNLTLLMTMGGLYILNLKEGVDERVRWFQAAVSAHPNSVVARSNLAAALCLKGDLDGAIATCEHAIHLNPQYAAAHMNLGTALYDKGDWDGAIAAFNESIRLDPTNAGAHANLGAALREKGKLKEAIAACNKAIELDATNAMAHANLGITLGHQGQLDAAIVELKVAVHLDPDLALAHYNLGFALGMKRDYEGAIRCFQEAIRINHKDVRAHSSLGAALTVRNRHQEAISALKTAIALDPQFVEGQYNLGLVLMKVGDHEGAVKCFETVTRLQPTFAQAHADLGIALNAMGEHDRAIAAFEQAIRLDSQNPTHQFNLSFALHSKGNLDRAIRELRAALRLDPDFAPARSGLAVLNKLRVRRDAGLAQLGFPIPENR